MLSATLRQLERDGLIERHVFARVPARVGYELSPAGEELLAALAPLAGWGVEHRAEVFAAREQFDRMQEWRANREGMQARSRAGAPPSQII
jgi:DNA-binding HxlR family transcriptional regulator